MDFRSTPEEERFRQEVRTWLAQNLPPGWATSEFSEPETAEEKIAFAKAWQRKLYEGGWAGISWPRAYGGRGASLIEQLIFNEEYAQAKAPDMINLAVGVGLVGPTLIAHGSEQQKKRFLRKILTGEEIWCQGFSEPNSGSDLAALTTRAEIVGDELVVTGQKIWTSFAHYADWCILLVRTDPRAPKHHGITFLLVDMRGPGITVRPLREMTGEEWFNEVFFDEVRVPRQNVVGNLHGGWEIAMTTLLHERGGAAPHVRLKMELEELLSLAHKTSSNGFAASSDPRHRQKLAQFFIEVAILRCTGYRHITRLMQTGVPGPEGSIVKLYWSELDQRMKEAAMEMEGPFAQLTRGSPRTIDNGRWQREFLWSRAATIYAGTSEIQRNIIAQRVLGLPKG